VIQVRILFQVSSDIHTYLCTTISNLNLHTNFRMLTIQAVWTMPYPVKLKTDRFICLPKSISAIIVFVVFQWTAVVFKFKLFSFINVSESYWIVTCIWERYDGHSERTKANQEDFSGYIADLRHRDDPDYRHDFSCAR